MRIFSFLILALCLFSQSAIGKKLKIEPSVLKQSAGVWIFEKVVDVPNTTKADLYKRLKKQIQSTVQSTDNVMTFDDVNYETIITSPSLSLGDMPGASSQQLNFKLTLEFKDNKFRIFATSFNYYAISGGVLTGGSLETFEWDKVNVVRVNPKADKAITAFLDEIETSAKSSGKDW